MFITNPTIRQILFEIWVTSLCSKPFSGSSFYSDGNQCLYQLTSLPSWLYIWSVVHVCECVFLCVFSTKLFFCLLCSSHSGQLFLKYIWHDPTVETFHSLSSSSSAFCSDNYMVPSLGYSRLLLKCHLLNETCHDYQFQITFPRPSPPNLQISELLYPTLIFPEW